MPAHSTTARTGPPGDDPGTGAGRAQQHLPRTVDSRAPRAESWCPTSGTSNRSAARVLGGLADRLGHLAGLAVAHADLAVLVADHHQGGEREVAAALDHLGDAVDVDDAIDQIARAVVLFDVPVTGFCRGLAISELQAGFARARRPAHSRGRGRRSRCGRTRPCRCPCRWHASAIARADDLGRARSCRLRRAAAATSFDRVEMAASDRAVESSTTWA